eukprot:3933495-Rhodomonas_salina.1
MSVPDMVWHMLYLYSLRWQLLLSCSQHPLCVSTQDCIMNAASATCQHPRLYDELQPPPYVKAQHCVPKDASAICQHPGLRIQRSICYVSAPKSAYRMQHLLDLRSRQVLALAATRQNDLCQNPTWHSEQSTCFMSAPDIT